MESKGNVEVAWFDATFGMSIRELIFKDTQQRMKWSLFLAECEVYFMALTSTGKLLNLLPGNHS